MNKLEPQQARAEVEKDSHNREDTGNITIAITYLLKLSKMGINLTNTPDRFENKYHVFTIPSPEALKYTLDEFVRQNFSRDQFQLQTCEITSITQVRGDEK
ncbi:hypothetical protein AB4254_12220 [Vibrio breoganii]